MLASMYMLTKNAHILFDPQEWKQLVQIAAAEHCSVNQLVRKAVQETFLKTARDEKIAEAVDEIRRIRPHFKGKIDYKALINHGRKY